MKRPTKRAPSKKPKAPEAPVLPEITVHRLKAWPDTFEPIRSGVRTFDVRLNDRHFKVGEIIEYREWVDDKPTGRTLRKTITYILHAVQEEFVLAKPRWGLKLHYCILSLKD